MAINTIKKANGNDVIISSFWAATNISTSGLALPNRIRAIVAKKINNDQIKRCFLLGSFLPLSENILSTKTAESTEVTKKPISSSMVVIFRNVEKG